MYITRALNSQKKHMFIYKIMLHAAHYWLHTHIIKYVYILIIKKNLVSRN